MRFATGMMLALMLGFAGTARAEKTDQAARTDETAECPCAEKCCPVAEAAVPEPVPRLEISFGSTQLFISQSIYGNDAQLRQQVVPVTAALFLFEYLFLDRFSAALVFNLPLETQRTLAADGTVREEYAAPVLMTGVSWAPASFELFKASRLDLQFAAQFGTTLGSELGDRVFPMATSRLHFVSKQGFALYVGASWAFQKETVALIYGIGHRF